MPSPAPFYNFAHIPSVTKLDDFWYKKQAWKEEGVSKPQPKMYEDIHMPRATPVGFILGVLAALCGFSIIWHMVIPGILSFLGIVATIILKSFNLDTDYYVKASEVEAIENAHFKEAQS